MPHGTAFAVPDLAHVPRTLTGSFYSWRVGLSNMEQTADYVWAWAGLLDESSGGEMKISGNPIITYNGGLMGGSSTGIVNIEGWREVRF